MPLELVKITPPFPTATNKPKFSEYVTDCKSVEIPLVLLVQVMPFELVKIIPLIPTITNKPKLSE